MATPDPLGPDSAVPALIDLAAELAGAPTLGGLLARAAGGAVRLLRADAAAVLLRDDRTLGLAASAGLDGPLEGELRIAVGDGFAGHLAEGVEPCQSRVAANEPLGAWVAVRRYGLQTLLGSPLLAGGVVVGVAVVGTARSLDFDTGDHDRFVALCRLLAPSVRQHQALARAELAAREGAEAARELELWRGDVMRVLVHDLRTPLGSITVGAGTLARERGGDLDASLVRRTAEIIGRSAARIQRLVDDVADLALVRGGRLRVEPSGHDPAALAETAVTSLRLRAADKGVGVVVEAVGSLPRVLCDPEKTGRALGCLLELAVAATPKDAEVRVAVQARDGEVLFAVEDHGPGLEPEQLDRSFDEHHARGSGPRAAAVLALALARALVVAQGGRMWADSRVGTGTTVSFTLPLEKA